MWPASSHASTRLAAKEGRRKFPDVLTSANQAAPLDQIPMSNPGADRRPHGDVRVAVVHRADQRLSACRLGEAIVAVCSFPARLSEALGWPGSHWPTGGSEHQWCASDGGVRHGSKERIPPSNDGWPEWRSSGCVDPRAGSARRRAPHHPFPCNTPGRKSPVLPTVAERHLAPLDQIGQRDAFGLRPRLRSQRCDARHRRVAPNRVLSCTDAMRQFAKLGAPRLGWPS